MTMDSNHNVTMTFQAGASMTEFMNSFQRGGGGSIPGLASGEGSQQVTKGMAGIASEIKRRIPPLDAFFKSIGIEVSLKSILKQSQIFTSSVGSIFQIMGALVDVMLAPFIKYIVKGIEIFASWIPKIGTMMAWLERNFFAHLVTVIGKFKSFLTDPLGFIFRGGKDPKPGDPTTFPGFFPVIGGQEVPDIGVPDSAAEMGILAGGALGAYGLKRKFLPKTKAIGKMNMDELGEGLTRILNNFVKGSDEAVEITNKMPKAIEEVLTSPKGLPRIVSVFENLFTGIKGGRAGLLTVVVGGVAGLILAVKKLFGGGADEAIGFIPEGLRASQYGDEISAAIKGGTTGTGRTSLNAMADLETQRLEANEFKSERRAAEDIKIRRGTAQARGLEAEELLQGGWAKNFVKSQQASAAVYTDLVKDVSKIKDAEFITSLKQLKKVLISDEGATALSRTTRGLKAAVPILGTAGAAWMGYEGFKGHQEFLTSQGGGGLNVLDESTDFKEALQTMSVMGMDIGGTAIGMISSFMGPWGWAGAAIQEGQMMGTNQLTGQRILDYTIPGALVDVANAVGNIWSPEGIHGQTLDPSEGKWDYYRDPTSMDTGYALRKIEGMEAQAVEITVNVNTGAATFRDISADVAEEFWKATTITDAEGNASSVQVEASSNKGRQMGRFNP